MVNITSNAAPRWDLRNKTKDSENIVEGLIMNSIECQQSLSNIVDGIHTWTVGQQSVLYAHLSILDDAISACSKTMVQFRRKQTEVSQWQGV